MSVPRVAPLPESAWTVAHREALARHWGDMKVDAGLATLMRFLPLAEAVMPMTRYVVESSSLARRHRMILVLRAAWLARSEVIWSTHAGAALDAVLTREDLDVIAGASAAGWDAEEVMLLRAADELFGTSSMSDSTWEGVAAGREVGPVMDVVETVAHVTFLACLYNSFGVQPDAEPTPALPGRAGAAPAENREPALRQARIEPVEGEEIAVLRTFARHPEMTAARRPRANFVNRVSPLSPHDREMLILRIGWDCRSEYEWAKHVGSVGRARDHGVDPELVAAGPDAEGLSEKDALLLAVADELHTHTGLTDPTWAALIGHFGLEAAMSAVFTAGSYRSTSMSLNAYGVQLEPGDEGFPALSEA